MQRYSPMRSRMRSRARGRRVTRRSLLYRRPSSGALLTLLLAAVGSVVIAVVWRRRAAPRQEHLDDAPSNVVPQVPVAATIRPGAAIQVADSGSGPLVHRRYEIELQGVTLAPSEILSLVQQHLTELPPSALADFVKSRGAQTVLSVGDEYQITMLGPWNGVVRVADKGRDFFTLVTLDGHPEAGHITFSVRHDAIRSDSCSVRVESWAKARDALVNVAFRFGPGSQVQTEVWVTFLQRVASLVGVAPLPSVQISSESVANSGVPTGS